MHRDFSFKEGEEKSSLLSLLKDDAEKLLAVETFLEFG